MNHAKQNWEIRRKNNRRIVWADAYGYGHFCFMEITLSFGTDFI